jgi:tetratricopeptide (TPR) repeat protein
MQSLNSIFFVLFQFIYFKIKFASNLKSVIDKDKENYSAWLLTGAAAFELGNKDQALAAYQRAIQINHNQPPAWQVRKVMIRFFLKLYIQYIY